MKRMKSNTANKGTYSSLRNIGTDSSWAELKNKQQEQRPKLPKSLVKILLSSYLISFENEKKNQVSLSVFRCRKITFFIVSRCEAMLCVIKVIQLSTKYAFFKRWLPQSTGKQIMHKIIYVSNTQSTAVWAVNYVLLKCNVFHFLSENSNKQTSLEKEPFSRQVAGAILVYKTVNRRPCSCTEKILRGSTFFSCKNFLFLQETCLAADHVTDNDL